MDERESIPAPGASEKVATKEILGYGVSGVPGGIFIAFLGYLQAFYYAWMGLQWEWIVIAQVIYAVWNTVNDPLFGYLQDRTRTRSGRYKPWIKVGAPLFSIAFVFVFFPPANWNNHVGGIDYQFPLFLWYLISQLAYDTFFTICYLACSALLPQMTLDNKERTKISIIAAGFDVLAAAAAGLVPMIFLTKPDGMSIAIFQVTVVIYGVISLIPWYLVMKYVRERQEYIPPKQYTFKESAKVVFSNPAGRVFIIYEGISTGLYYFVQTGFPFVISWIFGNNSYNGSWTFWNSVPFLLGPLGGIIAGAIVQLYIPRYRDLKTAIMVSMIVECIGFSLAFLGAIVPAGTILGAYNLPPNAWLASAGFSIAAFGLPSDLIYHAPVRSLVVDQDEVFSGERREAMYAGLGCIFSKPMASVALAMLPAILAAFRLIPASASDLNTGLVVVGSDFGVAITGVSVAAFLVPAILAAIGMIAWHFFPIDRKAVENIRTHLDVVHEKKRVERIDSNGVSKFVG
jgi:glycoside/pentoside/hexuronide:cation symporter, GPH family